VIVQKTSVNCNSLSKSFHGITKRRVVNWLFCLQTKLYDKVISWPQRPQSVFSISCDEPVCPLLIVRQQFQDRTSALLTAAGSARDGHWTNRVKAVARPRHRQTHDHVTDRRTTTSQTDARPRHRQSHDHVTDSRTTTSQTDARPHDVFHQLNTHGPLLRRSYGQSHLQLLFHSCNDSTVTNLSVLCSQSRQISTQVLDSSVNRCRTRSAHPSLAA